MTKNPIPLLATVDHLLSLINDVDKDPDVSMRAIIMRAAESVMECCEVCEAGDLVRERADDVLRSTVNWLQAADPALAVFDRKGLRHRRYTDMCIRVMELRQAAE